MSRSVGCSRGQSPDTKEHSSPRANSTTASHLWAPSAVSLLPTAIPKLLLWDEPSSLSSETDNGGNVKHTVMNSCLGGRVFSFTQWKTIVKVKQHPKVTCWPVIPISLLYILIFACLTQEQANGTRGEVVLVLGGFFNESMMAKKLSRNDWGKALVTNSQLSHQFLSYQIVNCSRERLKTLRNIFILTHYWGEEFFLHTIGD